MSRLGLSFLLLSAMFAASDIAADEPLVGSIDIYVRSDSETCRRAVDLAKQFAADRRALQIVVHDVVDDEASLRQYYRLVKQSQIAQPTLPGTAFGTQFRVGFTSDDAYRSLLDDMLTIRVYAREGCPHCRDAKRFLEGLVKRRPALRLEIHDVVADLEARRRMEQLAKAHRKQVTGLPVVEAGGQLFVGYQTDGTSGRRIEALFETPLPATDKQSNSHLRMLESIGATVFGFNEQADFPAHAALPFAMQVTMLQLGSPDPRDMPPPLNDDLPPPPPDSLGDEESNVPAAEGSSEEIDIPYFGVVQLSDWGMPLFTLIVGLVDGFNPCAMWVLVFLLSVLVNVRSRVRILAIAGTFVLVSGLAYFAFMAAWLNIFMLLGFIRPLQIALGCVALCIGLLNVKDFFAFHRGLTLSIPESAKPGIYARVREIVLARSLSIAVPAAVVLAIVVNTVELLCTAGLPALYGEILTLQQLPWWQNYLYLGLYIAAYMFDDALLLTGFVFTLSRRKLQEQQGRWLKLVSGIVILLLGLAMVFKPEWLYFGRGPESVDNLG